MENVVLVLFLIFLEGILSFDNALALAAMVHPLPKAQQRKALTYGILGAYGFRFLSLFFITHLLENPYVRTIGSLYLIWLCISHLVPRPPEEQKGPITVTSFWRVVCLVELTDIVFSIDSILAASAVSQVLWVVVTGAILGIAMMRFMSSIFINLIDTFPRLEKTAFLLVGVVGFKMFIETALVSGGIYLDFHSVSHPEFWVYWTLMVSSMVFGFTKRRPFLEVVKNNLP